jgi:hypothetical protein
MGILDYIAEVSLDTMRPEYSLILSSNVQTMRWLLPTKKT